LAVVLVGGEGLTKINVKENYPVVLGGIGLKEKILGNAGV
jgi:hypothetical protein